MGSHPQSLVPSFVPFLTKAEVCKVGYTHYASMAEAEETLGYTPVVPYQEGILRARRVFAPQLKAGSMRGVFLALLFGLVLIALWWMSIMPLQHRSTNAVVLVD